MSGGGGRGTIVLARGRVPHPVLPGGGGTPSWPGWGRIPDPDLANGIGYPILSWSGRYSILGYPPPPESDLGPVTGVAPSKEHGTSGSIMGWRWGTPQKGHGTSGSIMKWRWSKPPPPLSPKQTHTCENITSLRGRYQGSSQNAISCSPPILIHATILSF